LIVKQLREKVPVTRNGRKVMMTKAELIARQIVEGAAKGDFKTASIALSISDASAAEARGLTQADDFPFPDKDGLRLIKSRLDALIDENADNEEDGL
jgi:hypothetical protein